jgi:hypothetical protein
MMAVGIYASLAVIALPGKHLSLQDFDVLSVAHV